MADTYNTRGVAPQAHGMPRANLGGRLRTVAHLSGAAISLALVLGVTIWGYRLVMRDVTGIPVVRAVEGPMRVQPENPGGDPADHQGLAVNAVAADGTAEPPADRLVLAPRPVDLTEDDMPRAAPAAEVTSPAARSAEPVQAAEIDAVIADVLAPGDDAADRIVQPAPLVIEEVTQAAALPVIETLPASEPGVSTSLRPRVRPQSLATGGPERVVTASAPVEIDIAPEEVPVGTRVVQFGAFDTPEVARAEWDRLDARFADYMAGKRRIVQEASSGGRTFYRLRAMGFVDLSDARRFCSALVAEGADCIPLVTR